jgi:hypothetical protein
MHGFNSYKNTSTMPSIQPQPADQGGCAPASPFVRYAHQLPARLNTASLAADRSGFLPAPQSAHVHAAMTVSRRLLPASSAHLCAPARFSAATPVPSCLAAAVPSPCWPPSVPLLARARARNPNTVSASPAPPHPSRLGAPPVLSRPSPSHPTPVALTCPPSTPLPPQLRSSISIRTVHGRRPLLGDPLPPLSAPTSSHVPRTKSPPPLHDHGRRSLSPEAAYERGGSMIPELSGFAR